MRKIFLVIIMAILTVKVVAESHPVLSLGSLAPDFDLPGVDGATHKLGDYASSPVLAVIFTCNHCPIAQVYEQRIEKLYEDYGKRGVAVVAIQGNDPKALTIDELDSSDMSDTPDEMRARVAWKHLNYPYLYDGETQTVTRAYGPQATPHVFIFDKERRLRYEGRFDDNYRVEKVTTQDARNAIDALLAGRTVAVAHTGVFGCSTKWQEKEALRAAAEQKLNAQTVFVDMANADELKKLRLNAGDSYTLVSFWATWCGSCVAEFADMQDLFRMYNDRGFNLVTVSANTPEEKAGVLKFLQRKHATSRNLLFASDDTAAMQKAFDPQWESAVPYTVLLAPGGRVLYSTTGSVDQVELRRKILASVPAEYDGFQKYWQQGN
jgi:peroxiredoxin